MKIKREMMGDIIYVGKNLKYDAYDGDGRYYVFTRNVSQRVPLSAAVRLMERGYFVPTPETLVKLRACGIVPPNDPAAVDNRWKDEPVFVIGSGPSLRGFDFSRLDGYKTIAVNHSIEAYPRASALVFGDALFYRRTAFNLREYAGLIFASYESAYYKLDMRDNVYVFHFDRERVGDTFARGLLFTSLSGTSAVNLAIIMGCAPIVLLGFDLYKAADGLHFYTDIPGQREPTGGGYAGKAGKFNLFAPWADRIINCSMQSKITAFRKQPIDEVLECLSR